jgi:hypothetical protein
MDKEWHKTEFWYRVKTLHRCWEDPILREHSDLISALVAELEEHCRLAGILHKRR